MKIRIVLADTDEKYINHFIRAFKIYYFNEVDIVTFSDSTALKKYILKFFGIFLKNLLILLTFYGNILYVMENIYK